MAKVDLFHDDGTPKRVRIYDLPEYTERFTVVFTGRYPGRVPGRSDYLGADDIGGTQWGEHEGYIDRPTYAHLGKPITFSQLPDATKKAVVSAYKALWKV